MAIRRVRILFALLVAVLAASLLSACGSGSANGAVTIRFVWWGNEDRAKATQSAIALFEKQNPNITVQTEYSGYDAYFQKLATQVAGGASPDLIQLDRDSIEEYQQKGVLVNLDQYTGSGALHTTQIAAQLLEGGKVNGNLYAVPAGQTTLMLVYDPAVWAKAGVTAPATGWTWAQFNAAMQQVGARSGTAGVTDYGWAVNWFEVWLAQHGKKLYTSDGKLGFTQQDLVDFWNLTAAVRPGRGASTPEQTTQQDGSAAKSALVAKQTSAEINYDSNLTGYLSAYGANLQAMPLPTDNGSVSGLAAMPPVTFAVSQRSKHIDAAVKLLDFLTNNPDAGKILGTTRGLPANQSIRQQVCAAAGAGDKAVCDYETAVGPKLEPSFGNWPNGAAAIKTDFQNVYDDVIFGRSSVSAAAARVITDAQQSLSNQ